MNKSDKKAAVAALRQAVKAGTITENTQIDYATFRTIVNGAVPGLNLPTTKHAVNGRASVTQKVWQAYAAINTEFANYGRKISSANYYAHFQINKLDQLAKVLNRDSVKVERIMNVHTTAKTNTTKRCQALVNSGTINY